jgi:hypothetical protein
MDSQAFVGLLNKVTKDWTRQRKQELKDQQAILRRREKLTVVRRLSQKEVAYAYMPTAYRKASAQGTLPAHARQIMYAARGYIQSKTRETLSDEYFTQNLLPGYLIDYPEKTRDWDVVFDARGHLVEPHTGRKVALGTLPVRQYVRGLDAARGRTVSSCLYPTIGPKHRYRAVLFIEKEGFIPLFEKTDLANRYDIAIMSTKGVSTTAARELIDQVCGRQKVPLLILRDFDKAGFTIAGTLQRATWRFSFRYAAQVTDLGLRLADVENYGLEAESVSYGKTNPKFNLRDNGATQEEIEFLAGRSDGYHHYGQRVELNAFASDQLMKWIESKLEENDIDKLIPEQEILETQYRRECERQFIDKEIARIRQENAERFATLDIPSDLTDLIRDRFTEDKAQSWDEALSAIAEEQMEDEDSDPTEETAP